jgi:hypothetical protein
VLKKCGAAVGAGAGASLLGNAGARPALR